MARRWFAVVVLVALLLCAVCGVAAMRWLAQVTAERAELSDAWAQVNNAKRRMAADSGAMSAAKTRMDAVVAEIEAMHADILKREAALAVHERNQQARARELDALQASLKPQAAK